MLSASRNTSSHDRDEVFRLADSIAVVSGGTIDAFGTKDAVFSNPQTRMGAMLTGCKNISAAQVLDATHIRAVDWGLTLEVPQILPPLPTSIRAPAPRGVAPEEAMTVTMTRFSPASRRDFISFSICRMMNPPVV